MKVRTGFVSNSSSSSFVAVIEKQAFDTAMEETHPYFKKVIETVGFEVKPFVGTKVVLLSTFEGMGGDGTLDYIDINYSGKRPPISKDNECFEDYMDDCEEGEEPESTPQSAFDDFLAEIPSDKIVTHSRYN